MQETRITVVVVCAFLCLGQGIENANGQIRFQNRGLMGDLGRATLDRKGNPVVSINPRMCARLGPDLCNFFKAHEVAHHRLGHFHRNISMQQAEAEADRFAARNSSPQSIRAAQQYFSAGGGATRLHGSSMDRLARITPANTNYTGYRTSASRPTVRYASGTRRYTQGNRVYVQQVQRPQASRVRYTVAASQYRPAASQYRSHPTYYLPTKSYQGVRTQTVRVPTVHRQVQSAQNRPTVRYVRVR